MHDASQTSDPSPSLDRNVSFDQIRDTVMRRLFAPKDEVSVGQSLGRYVITGRIGAGGMGVVLRAFDPRLRREVALKRVRGLGSTPHRERRLVREAQTLAALRHPNVVAVHDLDDIEGRKYLVMEYLEGTSLAHWLAEGTRSLPEILEMFVQCARGLAAAHAVGIVHRDFKPSNVIVCNGGRVCVTDFGLARHVDDTSASDSWDPARTLEPRAEASRPGRGWTPVELTSAGSLVGTVAYMSPEQHGRADVDPRADQYAWCTALWEAIWGARPFAGDADELEQLKRAGPPPPPDGSAPRWLVKVLRRGLAGDPDQRFVSMHALLSAIARGRRGRRVRLLAVAVLAIAAVVAAFVTKRQIERHAAIAACESAAARIYEVWNPELRDSLVARGLDPLVPPANTAVAYGVAVIDGYAQEWAHEREQVCRSATVDRDGSHAFYVRASQCLDDRIDNLVSFIDAVEAAPDRAIGLDDFDVPRASECVDPALLARRPELPADPDARAAVTDVRRRMFAMVNRNRAPTDAELSAMIAEADAIGWQPLRAEVRQWLGRHMTERAHFQRGLPLQQEALALALQVGDYSTAADAASKLGAAKTMLGMADGVEWARLGVALTERGGASMREWLSARRTLATVLHGQGDLRASMIEMMALIAGTEWGVGPVSPNVADMYRQLALLHRRLRDPATSRRYSERADALLTQSLGAANPRRGNNDIERGQLEFELGRFAEALAFADQAIANLTANFGGVEASLGYAHNLRGMALRGLRRYAEAVAAYATADAIFELLGAGAETRVMVERNGSRAWRELGIYVEAARWAQRALDRLQATTDPDPEEVAMAEIVLATTLVRVPAEVERGRALLDKARASFAGGPEAAEMSKTIDDILATAVDLPSRRSTTRGVAN